MTYTEKKYTMLRLQAHLECLNRQTRGIGEVCGECSECSLNYSRGTLGEHKTDIERALLALSCYEVVPE